MIKMNRMDIKLALTEIRRSKKIIGIIFLLLSLLIVNLSLIFVLNFELIFIFNATFLIGIFLFLMLLAVTEKVYLKTVDDYNLNKSRTTLRANLFGFNLLIFALIIIAGLIHFSRWGILFFTRGFLFLFLMNLGVLISIFIYIIRVFLIWLRTYRSLRGHYF